MTFQWTDPEKRWDNCMAQVGIAVGSSHLGTNMWCSCSEGWSCGQWLQVLASFYLHLATTRRLFSGCIGATHWEKTLHPFQAWMLAREHSHAAVGSCLCLNMTPAHWVVCMSCEFSHMSFYISLYITSMCYFSFGAVAHTLEDTSGPFRGTLCSDCRLVAPWPLTFFFWFSLGL